MAGDAQTALSDAPVRSNPFATDSMPPLKADNPFEQPVDQQHAPKETSGAPLVGDNTPSDGKRGNPFAKPVHADLDAETLPFSAAPETDQSTPQPASSAQVKVEVNRISPVPQESSPRKSTQGSTNGPPAKPTFSIPSAAKPQPATHERASASADPESEKAPPLELDTSNQERSKTNPFLVIKNSDDGTPVQQPGSPSRPEQTAGNSETTDGQLWQLQIGTSLQSNLTLVDLQFRAKQGHLSATDRVAPVGQELRPAASTPELAHLLKKKPARKGKTARKRNVPSWAYYAAASVAGILIIAVGIQMAPTFLESLSDAGVNPFRRVLDKWHLQFPEVDGSSKEYLVKARQMMREDTSIGYQKADEYLRQAILLDPSDHILLAAYIENFGLLPTSHQQDTPLVSVVRDGIDYLERLNPNDPAMLRAKGIFLIRYGSFMEGQRALAQSDALLPEDPITLTLLAQSYVNNNPGEAKKIIRQVRIMNPESRAAALVEASALRRLGYYQKAKPLFDRRLKETPEHVGTLLELAYYHIDLSQQQKAREYFNRALNLEPNNAALRVERALVSYQFLNDRKTAESDLNFVINELEFAPTHVTARAYSHFSYLRTLRGSTKEAIGLAEKATELRPNYAPPFALLARARARENLNSSANEALLKAIKLLDTAGNDPFLEANARTLLADLQVRMGDTVNAIRNYEKTMKGFPTYARAYLGLAAAFSVDGKASPSASALMRLLNVDPLYHLHRRKLTELPEPSSDIEVYLDRYRSSSVPQANAVQASLAEGIMQFYAGHHKKAKALLKKTLRADSKNLLGLLYLGAIEIYQKKYKSAVKTLTTASSIFTKKNLQIETYLAFAELKLGQIESAEKRLDEVLGEHPEMVTAKYTLALLRYEQDRIEESRKILDEVRALAPDFSPLFESMALIKR